MRIRGIWMCLALSACGSTGEAPRATAPEPYVLRSLEGWSIHVARGLVEEQADLGREALRVLEVKLFEIGRVVPARALGELRKVPIWLCVGEGTKGGGRAEYHPSETWLRENGYKPFKAKGVEIGDAAGFLDYSIAQPWVLLHELAHAYHDRVLGFDHPGIRAAYQAALRGKKYERVLHADGARVRHYALTDEKEYFAECSEAWFGTNDFYPFVRAELRDFDPEAARLLEELWGR
jgi:hypothetical protein